MGLGRLSKPQRLSAIAMLVVAIGSVLPWVSFVGQWALGIEGNGRLTLGLALAGSLVLALTVGLFGDHPRIPFFITRITMLVMSTLATIIAIRNMNGDAALGLYLTLTGSIAWTAGAVWDLVLHHDHPSALT